MSCEQANGCIVNIRVQSPLCTARHQRDAFTPDTLCRKYLRIVVSADRRNLLRRDLKHGAQPRIWQHFSKRIADFSAQKRQPEPHGIGQNFRQDPPQQAIIPTAPVVLLDIFAGVIDQMHIMHTGRARRHTGKTRQATVDMLDRMRIRFASFFQHILHKVNTTTRAVQLIP